MFTQGVMNPHGTHVAGLVGAHRVGVNREARMVSVPVLDDAGRTRWSVVLKALEWLASQPPAILNLSLVGHASEAIDGALRLMVGRGWKVVAAAGNEGVDACAYSPAREPSVVTVGALNQKIRLSDITNVGPCVDILAPGSDILSTYPDNRWALMSGTSMATPLVVGAWAMYPQLTAREFLKAYTRLVYPLNKTMLDCKTRCKGGLSECIKE
jgi:subtilisin family serine protease